MKQKILVVLALLLTVSVQGQQKFEIGLSTGGGYFITGNINDEFRLTNSFSLNGGVYLLKPFFNRQFVESGVLFNYRNTAIDERHLQVEMSLNSFEVPLNYGWKISECLIIKTGVSGAWLLAQNIEREKFEMNGLASIGYDFDWAKIFLNYQHGLNKTDFIYKHDDRGLFIKNRRSLIKLEVNIPLLSL